MSNYIEETMGMSGFIIPQEIIDNIREQCGILNISVNEIVEALIKVIQGFAPITNSLLDFFEEIQKYVYRESSPRKFGMSLMKKRNDVRKVHNTYNYIPTFRTHLPYQQRRY